MTDRLNIVGIGVGPFNLSLAALAEPTGLRALFFEARPAFSWHPGLTLPASLLQVSPLKDCVTLVDPTSRFSFLNYLASHRRLYNFANRRGGQTSRREFTDYFRWVASQLSSLRFGESVEHIARCAGGFTIETNNGVYQTESVVVGVGIMPRIPDCARSHQGDAVYHAAEFLSRPEIRPGERVLVVGGGQSGAEIVEHLLCTPDVGTIVWATSRSNLFTMDDSAFVNEAYTPTYSRRFHSLPFDRRRRILEDEKLTSDGISANLSNRLYDLLYELSVDATLDGKISILTDVRMEDISPGRDGRRACLRSSVTGRERWIEVDRIILATGFEPRSLPLIEELTSKSCKEGGMPALGRDYAVTFPHDELDGQGGKLFLQNRSRVQHGLQSVNLSLVAFRNSLIINSVLGYEHYPANPDRHFLGSLDDIDAEASRLPARTCPRPPSGCDCSLARAVQEHA